MAFKMTPGSKQKDSPTPMRDDSPVHKFAGSSSPLMNKPDPAHADRDKAAYEAYVADFKKDVATGKYGDPTRKPLTFQQAYRIGFKSPSQSKAVLASNSRVHGRDNIDEKTGRSVTRRMDDADKRRVGLGKDFKQSGQTN